MLLLSLTKELEQKVTAKINFNCCSSHHCTSTKATLPRPWSHPELVYVNLLGKIYMPPSEFPTAFYTEFLKECLHATLILAVTIMFI